MKIQKAQEIAPEILDSEMTLIIERYDGSTPGLLMSVRGVLKLMVHMYPALLDIENEFATAVSKYAQMESKSLDDAFGISNTEIRTRKRKFADRAFREQHRIKVYLRVQELVTGDDHNPAVTVSAAFREVGRELHKSTKWIDKLYYETKKLIEEMRAEEIAELQGLAAAYSSHHEDSLKDMPED